MLLFQDTKGIFVQPSGIERSFSDCFSALHPIYGDKQGKRFRVWVDRLSFSQIGSDIWLVKFDKWDESGEFFNLFCLSNGRIRHLQIIGYTLGCCKI